MAASYFFKEATEQYWEATSVLTLVLCSDNLLTGYEQLRYYNNSIKIYQFMFD